MQDIFADELMEEVYRQLKDDDGGDIVRFCKLFDQHEIDIVIGRLEIALAISEQKLDVRAEDNCGMIKTLKSARRSNVERPPERRSG